MYFNAVLHQVIIMFLLMAGGFAVFKRGITNEATLQSLTYVLLMIISPIVIIYSFQLKYSAALLHGMLIAAASAFAMHLFSALLGQVLFARHPADKGYRGVLRFAIVYSNCGYIGIPLLSAVLGSKGIFYVSIYMAVYNLFNWTHGVFVFTGKTDRKSLLKVILNPNLIAVIIGMLIFFFSFQLPSILHDSLEYIFNMNTPLAMLVIGGRLAQVDLRRVLNDRWVWPGVFIKNFFTPLVMLFGLHAAGISGELLMACLLPIACPIAGNTPLFAGLYKGDAHFAAKVMAVSTLLSLVSIPLVMGVTQTLHF